MHAHIYYIKLNSMDTRAYIAHIYMCIFCKYFFNADLELSLSLMSHATPWFLCGNWRVETCTRMWFQHVSARHQPIGESRRVFPDICLVRKNTMRSFRKKGPWTLGQAPFLLTKFGLVQELGIPKFFAEFPWFSYECCHILVIISHCLDKPIVG